MVRALVFGCALLGCGRVGFDTRIAPDGGATDGATAADATQGASCEPFASARVGADLSDHPALALRDGSVLVGHAVPYLEVVLLDAGMMGPPRAVDSRAAGTSAAVATESGFVVGWWDTMSVFARAVDSGGVPQGAAVPLGASDGGFQLARRGNEIGAVWLQNGPRFRRLALDGSPLAQSTAIGVPGISSIDHLVATDTGYALSGSTATDAVVVRLDGAGQVIRSITLGPRAQVGSPRVAHADDAQYAIWTTPMAQSARIARIDAAGNLGMPVTVSTAATVLPDVAWTGDRVAVALTINDATLDVIRLEVHYFDGALGRIGTETVETHAWPASQGGGLAAPTVTAALGRVAVTAVYEVDQVLPRQQTTALRCH